LAVPLVFGILLIIEGVGLIIWAFRVRASRHGEALERIESSGQHCLVRERALKALIDQPKLEAAKQVLDD